MTDLDAILVRVRELDAAWQAAEDELAYTHASVRREELAEYLLENRAALLLEGVE